MMKSDYKIEVAIYLKGNELDPAHVSQVLGISPSKSQYKGEKKITSSNREIVAQIGLWSLMIAVDSKDLSKIITGLTSKVEVDGYTLAEITGVQEAYLDIFMAMDAEEDGGGTCEFQLSEENITTLEKLKIPIRFTIAVINE